MDKLSAIIAVHELSRYFECGATAFGGLSRGLGSDAGGRGGEPCDIEGAVWIAFAGGGDGPFSRRIGVGAAG